MPIFLVVERAKGFTLSADMRRLLKELVLVIGWLVGLLIPPLAGTGSDISEDENDDFSGLTGYSSSDFMLPFAADFISKKILIGLSSPMSSCAFCDSISYITNSLSLSFKILYHSSDSKPSFIA